MLVDAPSCNSSSNRGAADRRVGTALERATMNTQLMRQVAARGKYAPLFRHLAALDVGSWRATFREVESILGFTLPNSARVHRPWWSNQADGGHSHALAWHAAGWKTRAVDLTAEVLVFERMAVRCCRTIARRKRSRWTNSSRRTISALGRMGSSQAASKSTAAMGGRPCSWTPTCW